MAQVLDTVHLLVIEPLLCPRCESLYATSTCTLSTEHAAAELM